MGPFSSNRCPDYRTLDAQMHKGEVAAPMAKSFEAVKVDFGRFEENQDLCKKISGAYESWDSRAGRT
jgi:hypothetical protein